MISIIIPTYNEQDKIGHLLQTIANKIGEELEVVVSDGGSTDRTTDIVNGFEKVKLVKSEKGRALQFNNGVKESKGNILFFIHADSELPNQWENKIQNALAQKKCIAGTFYVRFDKEGLMYRLYTRLSKIEKSIFTYGDQGLFVKQEEFNKINGYPLLPIMEDYEIIKSLKKQGMVSKLDTPIITSSRKFVKNGVIFQQLKNIVIVLLYSIGVRPLLLAKWYAK